MKQHLTQCTGIVLAMLISLCDTSCSLTKEMAEASFDVGRKKTSGSYYPTKADNMDVGFNIAYLFIVGLTQGEGTTSLLQPTEYQLAYATTPQAPFASRRYQRVRPSLSYKSSESEFLGHLRLLTGLEFIQKNSKDEGTKLLLNYLQVPIVALYNHDLDDERKIFGGLGPYLAYGIGGKIKGDGFSEKAFDEDLGFKRFDAGLTFTAGYKFHKNWSVRLAYDLGLANIEHDSDVKTKNRCFSVNIGYWPRLIQKLTGK